MKTPRIHDFDPEAAERQLGTPLDGMPRIEKPKAIQSVKPRAMPVSMSQAPKFPREAPIRKSNGASTQARRYVRRTFDIYDDQLAYLTRAALEGRLAGEEGSMNAMIREAIDNYIAQHRDK
jgi:hypothetical protein